MLVLTSRRRLTVAVKVLALALAGSAHAESLLERGNYLVNSVMACGLCHTPRGPNGLIADKEFSGGPQTFDTPAFTVKGANITADRETGIGNWTDADVKRALTQGVRPNGTALAPIMPFAFYKILTPRDLDAVVAYVRSVPAVSNQVPAPVYRPPLPTVAIPGAGAPMAPSELAERGRRGFYLATIAHCMECHARRPDGVLDPVGWLGRGGHVMKGPFGAVAVRNITSHPTSGIGAWTDGEIKRALTHGEGRDGRTFQPPMARAAYFSRMTPADLDALVAYVRTLPPLE
jgi:mono/diheme cytochrome c family protein